IIFDQSLFSPAGVRRGIRIEQCVCGERRRALHEEFQVEPITRGAGCVSGVFTERFSRPGQRISFWNLYEHRFSCWELWAADSASFTDLVVRLSRIVPAMSGLEPGDGSTLCIPPGWTAGAMKGGDLDIPF